MVKEWKQWETIFLGSKITADSDCSHETTRRLLLERKAMTNLDSILKSRHYFANKGLSSQSYGFSNHHVWMWELDYKEGWALRYWCFWTVVLEKIFESPLDCKGIQPVNPKGNQFWIFIERTDAEAETLILGYLMWIIDSFEKTLMLGKIEYGRRRGQQRMRWWVGITNSIDMSLSKLQGVGDGQGSLACCSPRGLKESDMTEQLNWFLTCLCNWDVVLRLNPLGYTELTQKHESNCKTLVEVF